MENFLRRTLSPQGYPCLVRIDGGGHLHTIQCQDIDTAILQAENITYKYLDSNLYVSLGTLKELKPNAIKGIRTTNNIAFLKSLFFEIDVRPEKENCYDTFSEAHAELLNFIEETELPAPTIINSGGGLHVHWFLEESIELSQWREWLNVLLPVINHFGLLVDKGGMDKPTQICRVVGSHNTKYEGSPEVVVLDDQPDIPFKDVVSKLNVVMDTFELEENQRNVKMGDKNEVFEGFKDWKPIYEKCLQLHDAAFQDEPIWRGLLSIARICQDGDVKGEDLAHRESAKDKDRYNSAQTDEKILTIQNQQGIGGMPYSCSKWHDLRPEVCQKCEHYRSGIKNPVRFGEPNMELVLNTNDAIEEIICDNVPVEDEDPDKGHWLDTDYSYTSVNIDKIKGDFQNTDNAIFSLTTRGLTHLDTKDGNDLLVCKSIIYPLWAHIVDSDEDFKRKDHFVKFKIELPRGRINYCDLPSECLINRTRVVQEFAKAGVIFEHEGCHKPFSRIIKEMSNIVMNNKVMVDNDHFGWSGDGENTEFVLGSQTMSVDRVLNPSQLNSDANSIAKNLRYKGTLEGWQKAMSPFLCEGQEDGQFMMAVGFGAPLVQFSSISGMILSFVGETGTGKSTMQKASASIWGNPDTQLQVAPGTRTGNTLMATVRTIGIMHNLPIHMEEMTNMKDEDASELAYMITQGCEKSRLRQNKDNSYDIAEGVTWKTLITSSSNTSLDEKLLAGKNNVKAESMRIFEISDVSPNDDNWIKDRATLANMANHYGVAGRDYVSLLMLNRSRLKDLVDTAVSEMEQLVNADKSERFWTQGLACVYLGARMAKQAGIYDFNIESLLEYIKVNYRHQRDRVGSTDRIRYDLAETMLNELRPHLVTVRKAKGLIEVLHTPLNQIYGQLNEVTGELWVSSQWVRDFCNSKIASLKDMKESALRYGYIKEGEWNNTMRRRLTQAGRDGTTAQIRCFTMHLPPVDNNDDIIEEIDCD